MTSLHPYGRKTPHPAYLVEPSAKGLPGWKVRQFEKEDRGFDTEKAAQAFLKRVQAEEVAAQRPWSPFVQALPEVPAFRILCPRDFFEKSAGMPRVEWDAFARCLAVVDAFSRPFFAVRLWSARDEGWLFAHAEGCNGADASVFIGAGFSGSPLPSYITRHRPKGDPDARPLW